MVNAGERVKARILVSLVLFSILLCLFSSCGLFFGQKLRVQVNAAQAVNQNSPVALDVVLVYDENLLKELQKLTAKEWFEKRDQMSRDNPKGVAFDVWEWEVVPGHNVPPKTLYVPVKTMLIYPKAKIKAGVVFANYATPGAHRAGLTPEDEDVVIYLLEKEFKVEPLK